MMMNPASKIGWLACVFIALAAPAVARATDCEVLASGQLGNNDHIASYTGGCKNGRAQGQGEARWVLRYAPDTAPVVWQGRFDDGIYLAEPEILGARRLEYARVLLDLGRLTGPGRRHGHLWVESSAEGKLPPSACRPSFNLHVSTQGPLHDDALARQWLDAAYQRWQRICSASVPPTGPARPLRVRLHEGDHWMDNRSSALPAGVVQAHTALGTSTPPRAAHWQGYSNRPAQEHAATLRQQARQAELQTELQANEKRLRDFASAVGARRFVTLEALQQNPFRFGDEVLLVDLRLQEARTPTEAIVRGTATRYSGGSLLHGDIAQWNDTSRLVAVRVQGRSEEPDIRGMLLLQLIDSRVCAKRNCDDFLVMPDKRRLNESEL